MGREAIHDLRRVLRKIGSHEPSIVDVGLHARLQAYRGVGVGGYRLGGPEGEYIAGWNLPGGGVATIEEARLQILLTLDQAKRHIHVLSITVDGVKPGTNDSWRLAVHLPDDRRPEGDHQGLGACSHPALHCHVGPDAFSPPEVRAPMPPGLGPGELLQWVLSQVLPVPAFEPAPWAAVTDALSKQP